MSKNRQDFLNDDFIKNGERLLKFVAEYHNNIRKFPVRPSPDLKPGYLRVMLPSKANDKPISFESVFIDIFNLILPGLVHWQSPKYHGYYPTGFSYPSLYGDILSAAFSCIGFTWSACPIYTELEIIMMDWLAKEMDLPSKFIFDSKLGGGGGIEGSASESVLIVLIAAREKKISELLSDSSKNMKYYDVLSKLRAYTSDQTHSSIIKATRLSAIQLNIIESDKDLRLGVEELQIRIKQDLENGLIPFFVCCNIGTTSTCAMDNIEEIGQISKKYNLWLHIDAAYAGSLFLCKEYRQSFSGINLAQSFNFNPHKLMSICFDCSVLWVEDINVIKMALGLSAVYLKSDYPNIVEYKDWQVSLGRRFRSLKLYFHIKLLGMDFIKAQIRNNVALAEYLGDLIRTDERLYVPYPIAAGMLCFCVNKSNSLTQVLFKKLNEHDIYLTSTEVKGRFLIR
ncbi:aromatic-L-amino-acid decarboxylase-like isoform X2 [Gordionus sp. m RMFG-2023]